MRSRQSGIFLVSAAVAVGVVGMLITFWGVQQGRQMRVERAERVGESLKVIGNAVETFTVKHHGEIDKLLSGATQSFSVNGATFTKRGNPNAGGMTEIVGLNAGSLIKALKLSGVAATPPRGVGEYAMRVYRVCDSGNASSCSIETLTYLTEPIKKLYSSEPDLNLAAVAAKQMGVYGGLSTVDNAGQFRFVEQVEGALPVANPLQRPGLIAMRGGSQTKDLNNAVSRDGSRAMTGDLNFKDPGTSQKYSIVGVRDIKAEGAMDVGQITIASKAVASEMDAATLTTKSLTTSGPSKFGGELNMGKKDVRNAKTIEAQEVKSKRLRSTSGIVELNEVQSANESCNGSGIAVDGAGKVLSCQPDVKSPTGRLWKLSGTPSSKEDVPSEVVGDIAKEIITDMVLVGVERGESWSIWKLPVYGVASLGGASYRPALQGYSASNTVICGFASQAEREVTRQWRQHEPKLTRDSSGTYTLAGASRYPLLCLTRDRQTPVFEVDRTFEITATRYRSHQVEFERLLADIMLGGYTTNQVQAHAIGKMEWTVTDIERFGEGYGYVVKGARSCNVETFFKDSRGMEYDRHAVTTEAHREGVHVRYSLGDHEHMRATCRFDSAQDVRDAGFDEV
ncbi:hypothetical protein [Pandoraea bronchicola]|uniref:Uncharacterized protein n=1 Tax=Pandoraea bronchicola TaxID=2508287 RepID=A0A5E5BV89_9BURK|nr:hypothetical protein [Pandoraea bronchicola]VVE88985.1 hypothetical protein PBR20603_02949 [Pandoraea bronchicola]